VLEKAPTGIQGLDEITGGGLPRGRPTLIFGGAGSGKTLLGIEFLAKGATQFNEPGVLMSFEETEQELTTNVGSLGIDLADLVAKGKIVVDHVSIERAEIEETGEYDLEGLFVRLGSAIDSIKATRVVLDTIEVLYAGLTNAGIIRAELRRLFRWLKEKGVTTIVTGERGNEGTLTRYGLEEYVSDCVILLDNRVTQELSNRRLRIIKYRGSAHSTNEFPFIIDEDGISILPVTSVRLEYPASNERVSSGVGSLDAMLEGKGYLKGSTILISGMVGTGKTSLAAHLVDAGCRRGEHCLYLAFEESPGQIMRNMKSIGINLKQWTEKGLLHFHSTRVSEQGLEKHLLMILKQTARFQPSIVVVDALTDFISLGAFSEVRQMVLRIIDYFKKSGLSALVPSMSSRPDLQETGIGLSSAFDTWIHMTNIQSNLERNRTLVVVKSRGMAHSNQVREFVLTDKGVNLLDIYTSPAGTFMGSARLTQIAADKVAEITRRETTDSLERRIEEKRRAMEAKISSIRAEFEAEIKEDELVVFQDRAREKEYAGEIKTLTKHRQGKNPREV